MSLAGVQVLEFAGIGPGPVLGMMLADFGADVLRIDRNGFAPPLNNRGKRSLAIDLRSKSAQPIMAKLASKV